MDVVFKIPDYVTVGAVSFKILFNTDMVKKLDDRAFVSFKDQEIWLRDDMTDSQLLTNLLHEIKHVVDDTAGIEIRESEVVATGNLMAQALISMGIRPDFSGIKQRGDNENKG